MYLLGSYEDEPPEHIKMDARDKDNYVMEETLSGMESPQILWPNCGTLNKTGFSDLVINHQKPFAS